MASIQAPSLINARRLRDHSVGEPIHGPIGPVRLDEYGTPILDIHIRKVARIDGKLTNTIIKTYPQVSQFWTFDPKKFVEQPVFSRDFPPSKFLE